MSSFMDLPGNLPAPVDDGACDHLPGSPVPAIALPATSGNLVDLARLGGRTCIFAYPRTGPPGEQAKADWDMFPGARGCTPEACGFRDYHAELREQGVDVFGLSTQSTPFQQEVVERLDLPFSMLSDEELHLTWALGLPTFEFDEMTLIKRLTLVIRDGVIEHVFYPVFPPDMHAEAVVAWLATNP